MAGERQFILDVILFHPNWKTVVCESETRVLFIGR